MTGQGAECLSLSLESMECDLVAHGDDLDRDGPAKRGLYRAIDNAKAASSDLNEVGKLVRSEVHVR
jgi:hypothetical protein